MLASTEVELEAFMMACYQIEREAKGEKDATYCCMVERVRERARDLLGQ